ncbi:MAG: hypothetical protein NVS2B16_14470 [Chloroflexota bacterium]
MLKLVIFVVGLFGGGAGVGSWLISEPGAASAPLPVTDPQSLQARLELLKARFREAQAEGKQAQERTQKELQQKLDALRSTR